MKGLPYPLGRHLLVYQLEYRYWYLTLHANAEQINIIQLLQVTVGTAL